MKKTDGSVMGLGVPAMTLPSSVSRVWTSVVLNVAAILEWKFVYNLS